MKVNCKASKLAIIISTILLVMAILFKLLDIKYSNNFTGFMKDIFQDHFVVQLLRHFPIKLREKEYQNNIGMNVEE